MTKDFTLADFLPYLLNQAAEKASRDFAAIYKARYGLQRTDWRVLAHLGEFGTLTAAEICLRASEHKTRVSRAVSRLEGQGILKRSRRADDRRSEVLELTARGLQVYSDLTELAREHDRRIAKVIGLDNAQTLKSNLAQMAGMQAKKYRA